MKSDDADVTDLINELFRTRRRPDGREYSNHDVARGVKGGLTASYIAKLRRGEIKNPGRNALLMLGRFFDVRASYFLPELETEAPPVEDLADLVRRSSGLTPQARRNIAELIEMLKQAQAESLETES